jgi:uncharacterized membrane protein
VLATVDSFTISLFLHITAVMVGFGSTFALSVTTPIAMKLNPRHLPYVHQLELVLGKYFATPALVLVLVTGFYQVDKHNWDLGDAWISATLAIVVVIGALSGAYFIPAGKKLKALAERDIAASGDGPVQLSDEYNKRARLGAILGTLTGLLLVVAVFLMVTKPGI